MRQRHHLLSRRLIALITASLLLCAVHPALAEEPSSKELSAPLSANGELLLWTFADKIILPGGNLELEQTLNQELLPNERQLAPVGGDSFSFANRNYRWGAIQLVDGYYSLVHDEPSGGKPLDYSSAYLYCTLNSETAQQVTMLLRSDDSPKVYLNGQLVFSKYVERGVEQEQDAVPLSLKKGVNQLLVRVDNYVGGAGFHSRLIGPDGLPAKGLQSVIHCQPKVQAWAYKNSRNLLTAYAKIPQLAEEPFEAFFGARIQRTMTLLESSTPSRRNKVKILFYGQSIVAEGWHKEIIGQLEQRYPYAIIEVENRAIGGHTAPVLVRTAAQDLYPFYPDLVVFHVYNGVESGELERIFHNIRKYTTAEILTFSHHYTRTPRDIEPEESQYYKYLAQKYDCEFVDVYEQWGRYLQQHNMQPGDLLGDFIHHNTKGYLLISQMIMKHFKFNSLFPAGWYDQIKTYEARRFFEEKQDEIQFSGDGWKSKGHGWGVVGSQPGDRLKLDFVGNRVDVVLPPRSNDQTFGSATVLIDGQVPTGIPSVYVATRSSKDNNNSRPAIKRITLGDNAIEEEWTFRITGVDADYKNFSYEVIGSVTGHDGVGDKRSPFTSNSGRIRLAPQDLSPFNGPRKPIDQLIGFEVKWKVLPLAVDTWQPHPTEDPAIENATTLVQGLPNGPHRLEIILNGDGIVPIKALRVYEPPLK
ncbi:hypothetical protein SH580_01275 [Coraliomargarita algicola]|uniref:SGNH hydrolase-type esterase domain-containing protein n=1 Tax=Coraliomargarita algicola TaxID=3092156 RepID=A0ABZ0RJT6_9BACT|nr:hypothetical protein [Coraliomargarita sp. J2-16]WPJ96332.1 hypothetical protein SH580_01275 [Coraliomargarita sp. J2-16]